MSRLWWLPLAVVGGYLVIAGAALHVLGVAGYRAGWLWTLVILAGGAGALAWRALPREFGGRTLWLVAFVAIAVVASSWLVDHAPLSAPRVRAQVARLEPPFARRLTQRTSGHSWCRPTCPIVERTYRMPDTATSKALLDVIARMRLAGEVEDFEPVARLRPQRFIRVPGRQAITEVRATAEAGYVKLSIRITARRSPVERPGPLQVDSRTNEATR